MRDASRPLTAHEVSVRGADAALPRRNLVVVHTKTHRAARHSKLRTSLFEDLVEPFNQRLLTHLLRAGNDIHRYLRMNLAALEDAGGDSQIVKSPVGAGTDEGPVNRHTGDRLTLFELALFERAFRDSAVRLGEL